MFKSFGRRKGGGGDITGISLDWVYMFDHGPSFPPTLKCNN